ncbi:hypothetical protein FFT09_16365 [Saccharomonospora piscinae]|nr:hypothetical protein FFT09_16365 [Saccharomonospora piscinae]
MLAALDERPTTQLWQVEPVSLTWPTVDPDEALFEARNALHRTEHPSMSVLRAVLDGLRRLP